MTPIEAISNLPFAVALRAQSTTYIALTIVHVIGVALMLGNVWLVDLKLIGLTGTQSAKGDKRAADGISPDAINAKALSQASVVWSIIGFGLIIASGSVMAFAHAATLISNQTFLIKLGLITCAATNMIVLHSRDGLNRGDTVSKMQAALSLLLWVGVIAAGQLISARLHHP